MKSTSTDDMFFLNLKRPKIMGITAFLIVVSMFMSSCSLGSLPSRTTSDSAFPEETSDPSDTLDSETSEEKGIDTDLKVLAEEYMQVLCEGDPSSAALKFDMGYSDILPPTYPCDKEVFHTLFANMSYSYGTLVTVDHADYDLTVDCILPDIRGCVAEVLDDDTFMLDVCTPWILAMCDQYDSPEVSQAYADMKNTVLLEALRRINEGEFTDTLMFSSRFTFHDNGEGKWLCKKTPDFVLICGRDNYMKKLALISMMTEYSLVETHGASLYVFDKITLEKYREVRDLKKKEIIDATSEMS